MLRGALRLGAVLGAVLVSASSPAASNERPREPKSPIPFAPHPIEVNSTHDEALARCRSAGVSCRIVLGQPGQSIFETLAVAGREDPSLALEVRRDLLEDLERARRSTPVEVSTRFPGETPESLWATLTRALSLLDGKRRSLGGPSLGNQLAIRIRGSGDLKNNYDWYYEREEPYAICDGSNCAYRGTLHIYYDQDLNGYQMRYWHSFTADRETHDPFRILANHIQCRRNRAVDSDCEESPNPGPARDAWYTYLRQPDRGRLFARDGHDGKKFLNLRHDIELDIEGLPTVNVTGTDTSWRWGCDSDRRDKCRYTGRE